MDILGSIGQLYTFVLLVLLFLGSGLAVWALINSMKSRIDKMKSNRNYNKIIGGLFMKNNNFIKLAVFSFMGIIISIAVLAALPKNNTMAMGSLMNTQSSTNMQGMSSAGMQNNVNSQSMDVNSIQRQLYNIQQQLNQLQNQNQMNSSSMGNQSQSNMNNSMNSSSMNSSNMNSSNMNNNSNSGSMSSMPMM